MANIKQQKKRIRIAADQRLENLRYRSTIKTLTKRLAAAVEDGDAATIADGAQGLVQLDRPRGLARRAAPEHRRAQEVAGRAARLRREAELSGLRRSAALRDLDQRPLELEVARRAASHPSARGRARRAGR